MRKHKSLYQAGFIASLSTLCLLILFIADSTAKGAGGVAGYYRYADVNGDLVVFSSEGDIWKTTLSGGEAVRLTTHAGNEMYKKISPDGEWIAFTGEYDGNRDVYIIPSTGGAPVRLTFHGDWDEVVGWTKDSERVIFRSSRFAPNGTFNLYAVSIDGGYPQSIGLDKGTRISYEPGGDRFAYTRLRREKSAWKGYRGGRAMDIWIGNLRTMEFRKLTEFEGTDAFPMWIGDRIYFLSDRSGRSNIFSVEPDGSNLRQHTFNEKWDAHFPSTDGMNIVYQQAMDIWAFNIASNETRKIDITLPTDRIRIRDRIIDPKKYIDNYSIPNDPKRMAFAARGEVFTLPVDKEGYIRRITHTPEARDRLAIYSPDGKWIAALSDDTGEYEIYLYPSGGKGERRQLTRGGDMIKRYLKWSPDGEKIMYHDKADRLWIVDVESGRRKMILDALELHSAEWSPDSKWIAWIETRQNNASDIYLYNVENEDVSRIETQMINETDLSWDPGGKYLYFKAQAWYNPVRGADSFIDDTADKFFLILLDKETENPFESELVEAFEEEGEEEEDDDEKDDEEGDDDEDDKKKKKRDKDRDDVKIELDGLAGRICRMPIDAGNYFALNAVKGKIYYGSWENRGMRPQGERRHGWRLHVFNIEKEKAKTVDGSINGFGFSPDRKKMFVRKHNNYVVMNAGAVSIPDEDGKVYMDGWSLEIDPEAEWRQILREVWRYQRDYFYDPGMHGVDWEEVWDQYSELLPRISDREELNDLIAEMLGELNVGHAYIFGGDMERARHIGVAGLGVDLEPVKSGAFRITKILKGDNWGDEPQNPFGGAFKDIKTGRYIVAVDGEPLEPGDNIYQKLVNKHNKVILLSVNDDPDMDGAEEIPIKTINEDHLRYFDWVRDRREFVEELSDREVGYIHIPDMGSFGLSMWLRQYFPQLYDKKALIIDVRYNRGGNVANMILSVLGREAWAKRISRDGMPYNRPWSAFNGPLAAVCNHETASDGETFSEGFKRLELGKLYGTRTWGGWVGIFGGRSLVDHGRNTVPQSTGWSIDAGEWLIEGPGVTPTETVVDEPAKMIAGEDPQLKAAVEHLLNEIKTWKQPAPLPPYPEKPIKIRHLDR